MEASPKDRRPAQTGGGMKETIESVLIAFILAFIFRAFVVEAFVIPTGSMAPTLLGAHTRFTCPDCGYQFDVDFQARQEGNDISIPSRAPGKIPYPVHCPNCGYEISGPQVDQPPVHFGDRILVLKYLYLFEEPHRWDVVVFKTPDKPEQYHYATNYIKRLVGNPGETIMILDGDIYAKKDDHSPFMVQHKPPEAQNALWRIVYDNDYHPRGLKGGRPGLPWRQPWRADGAGWDVPKSNPRTFVFNNPNGSGGLHFDASTNRNTNALTDWVAYDSDARRGWDLAWSWVSDIKLDLTYQRSRGDGDLRLELTKADHQFTAVIGPKTAQILMDAGDGNPVPIAAAPIAHGVGPGGSMRIVFANVDYRVTLQINGRTLIQTTDKQYSPDINQLIRQWKNHRPSPRPEIRISAGKQMCTLSHVSLWRDIYYINRSNTDKHFWASPERPIKLGPDEFFVLGDNSLISEDARYWDEPVHLPSEQLEVESGRVPRRFLLGKAFFVYWPAGYPPFGESGPGIVPNFGEMRFIH